MMLDLPIPMPRENVSYTPANAITIDIPGNYDVQFMTNIYDGFGSYSVAVAVRVNGVEVPELTVTKVAVQNVTLAYTRSAIIPLAAGDVLTMTIRSNTTSTSSPYLSDTALIVTRLS